MTNQIQWTNALSTRPSLEAAVAEVVDRVQQLSSAPPHLGIVFIASAYTSDYPRLLPLLLDRLSLPVVIGCGGSGIVGMNKHQEALEIEGNAALSLSVAHLPGVEVQPFQVYGEDLPDMDSSPASWSDLLNIEPQKNPQFIILADPFSSRINDLLEGLDFAYPGSVKVGGLCSGNTMGEPSALFYYAPNQTSTEIYREGTIGVALSGNITVETIVAQGCRPIGEPYQITKGERNIVIEIADINQGNNNCSRPPLDVLRELIQTLDESDRQLAQNSLFIGLARDAFKFQLKQGDFLIRNLLGVDPRSGAMAIGDRVRPGQRIQFHLRDAKTSAEDLELLLNTYQQEKGNLSPAVGALMFSCLGRGSGLYGQANFDSNLFRHYLGNIHLGGFFCNGEIGPVGGRTFLHGYTSAFGIFRNS